MLLGMTCKTGFQIWVLLWIGAVLLTGCGQVQEAHAPEACRIEPIEEQLIEKSADGKVVWTKRVEGLQYRFPSLPMLADDERVYAGTSTGLMAVEKRNGRVVWESAEWACGVLLDGDKVITLVDRSEDPEGQEEYWVVAYRAETGEKVFETRLPDDLEYFQHRLEILRISEMMGMYLVQGRDKFSGPGYAVLIDRQGKVWHRGHQRILDGVKVGEDRVLLTSQRVVRLLASGQSQWERVFEWRERGGGVVMPGDGTLLAYLYGPNSDSGAQVMRIRIEDGAVMWQVYCQRRGFRHFRYSHNVDAIVDEKTVTVRSAGSSGSWVEVLDLQTGKQLKREDRDRVVDFSGMPNAKLVVP
jgi:outer membrane protein assembly factor BamB